MNKTLSNRKIRQLARGVHLIVGVSLILYFYSPLGGSVNFKHYLTIIAIPLVSLSGLVLWQQSKLIKWLVKA